MGTKQTKAQRIAELERKLRLAESYQVHQLHFASADLDKFLREKMMGSGVVLTIESLSGRVMVGPCILRDGLSPETVAALHKDLAYSYIRATELKPKGVDVQESPK